MPIRNSYRINNDIKCCHTCSHVIHCLNAHYCNFTKTKPENPSVEWFETHIVDFNGVCEKHSFEKINKREDVPGWRN